ncbi:NADH-quinone oxidoreductase subunit J [Rhodococcus sp. BP-149]|jgi:NADH-quinone oxidoreductase subunit J|uniref:NADH-quinone oxidoreductase subunit J n=1 Tax=unclassified Rhodococcus (in: high G+C Gram-positive bacteria) TaxID=192944 RepID=UPI000691CB62|nr:MULTISPECIES: NADH-quinone oxidoreductase subunit J [unclassified Rhodococcus (in: high G+C Gram-positive bacteria)]KQU35941.1 NADH:ubiquinone oxidoreductase subunit J [Rhodococcus sp. Leaf225]KQU48489.1 NADH:ubiquinone oxidoreductase subunit J [Rhodococcus sp. Leaf258]MBY6677300.1 NADH-quinone oxidoreductase subunit J [Rhodococcus sp. BP-332]MBY6684552.1 NADH-quinone oxidoreductase subunit J [Rhodococcus sp. BP-288]MBY6695481.1 NADH-quinone oxidoreductase subunit J [Rhodococcus sp. BP-188]
MIVSTSEAIAFWILAPLALIGALGVVASAKAVYSALFLASTMVVLAIFYIVQGAVFLGVVQIVVYTGAVMMLFLFVLMLVGVDSSDSLVESLRGHRIAAIVVGLGFGVLLIGGLGNAALSDFRGFTAQSPANVEGLAELVFVRYVWAFELTGALLITATIGAMVLTHRDAVGRTRTQKELSQDRFRFGDRVTPLPSPGVYARHNGVDRPARLPDGSDAESSVSRQFRDGPSR